MKNQYKIYYFKTKIEMKTEIKCNLIFKEDYKYYSNNEIKTINDNIRKYGYFQFNPSEYINEDLGLYVKKDDKKIKIKQNLSLFIYKVELVEELPNNFFD